MSPSTGEWFSVCNQVASNTLPNLCYTPPWPSYEGRSPGATGRKSSIAFLCSINGDDSCGIHVELRFSLSSPPETTNSFGASTALRCLFRQRQCKRIRRRKLWIQLHSTAVDSRLFFSSLWGLPTGHFFDTYAAWSPLLNASIPSATTYHIHFPSLSG